MVISEISLYNALKGKLGEQDAQTIIEGIKNEVQTQFENNKDLFATKKDVADVRLEIEKLRTEMKEMKAETIKWMFIFWVGQLASFIAIAKFFFHQ